MVVERIQLAQDLVGVVQLAPAAWQRVQTHAPEALILGLLEAAAIAFALIVGIRDLKFHPHEESGNGVDYTNLAIASALLAEWGFRVAAGRKWFSPLLLTAIAGFVLAFIRPFMQDPLKRGRRRRTLRFDDEGIYAHLTRWRRWQVRWSDLSAVELTGSRANFLLQDGTVRHISLRRYLNAEQIRAAITSQVQPGLLRY